VTYTNQWLRHMVLHLVDEKQEISRTIPPVCYSRSVQMPKLMGSKRTIIAQRLLVHDITLALMGEIGNPYCTDTLAQGFQSLTEVIKERFVQFLRHLSRSWRAVMDQLQTLTLGKPLACAAMTVISPGAALVWSSGIYCLTASFSAFSKPTSVPRGHCRVC
jgi:hypothetical protein